jgi:hypothetical protein
MRRWYAALGVAIICLVFTIGASSSDAVSTLTGPDSPKLSSATAVVTQQPVVGAPTPPAPAATFGSYAVIALETMIATALLCYAFLQRRRAESVPHLPSVVRLRGPPRFRDCSIVFAP